MRSLPLFFFLLLTSCSEQRATIHPRYSAITESIYASGQIKGKNQYQVFATVNGIIEEILVAEGDSVKRGQPIIRISNATQELARQNAALSATYYNPSENQDKLNETLQIIKLTRDKMTNDSLLWARQKRLFEQNVGSQIELEQRKLQYENARSTYLSAKVKHNDLKRQLNFNSEQAKRNLLIAKKLTADYTICSEIDGIVYSLAKEKGELVTQQTVLALIGSGNDFLLEMQVDEYDISAVKLGQLLFVTLDSYKGQAFKAQISRVLPLMNARTKSFTIEATFITKPSVIYPNTSFEANILVKSKPKALLIPRAYLLPNNRVELLNGTFRTVEIGLKDFQQVEVVLGVKQTDELVLPEP